MSDEYCTPPKLFKELDDIFHFFWDACCNEDNCLVKEQIKVLINAEPYKSSGYDYLEQNMKNALDSIFWGEQYTGTFFMNPPYSKPGPFIKKAWEDSKYFRVVMLLKCDMSTDWFNVILDEKPGVYTIDMHQRTNESLTDVIKRLEKRTAKVDYQNIGIIYLRKRIKFYASEEMMEEDASKFPTEIKCDSRYVDYKLSGISETKNFKRVEDDIVAKSSGTFPSMIMIFDRRGSK